MRELRLSITMIILCFAALFATKSYAVEKGTCGKNATYVLADNGVLTISGSGEIAVSPRADGYFHSVDVPWYNSINKIRKVIVKEGITSIGFPGFSGCYNLTEISIAKSVKTIMNSAFDSTMWKEKQGDFVVVNNILVDYQGYGGDIVIPNGIESISSSAFNKDDVCSIDIPGSIKVLSNSCLRDCKNLERLYFRGNCPELHYYVIYGTSRVAIYYPEDNDTWNMFFSSNNIKNICNGEEEYLPWDTKSTIPNTTKTDSGSCGNSTKYKFELGTRVLTIYGKGTMTNYGNSDEQPWNKKGFNSTIKRLIISDGVTSVGNNAFGGCRIKEVLIGKDVTSIGKNAFEYLHGVAKIDIPGNVKTIKADAFNLSSMNTLILHNGLTTIGNGAFEGCHEIENIVIPDTVTTIGEYAFAGNFWDGVPKLKSITFGKGVKKIGDNALFFCNNLKSIFFKGNRPECSSLVGVNIIGSFETHYKVTFYFPVNNMTWRTEKIIPLAGQSGSHGRYIAESWIPWNPQTGVFYTVKDIGNSSHRMISEKEGKYTAKHIFNSNSKCVICGRERISQITLSGISHQIVEGKSIRLTANISSKKAANKKLKWSSSNKKIAMVTQRGKVKISKGTAGKKVTITAKATDGSRKKAVYNIKVMKGFVKSVEIKGANKTLKVNKKMPLKAVVKTTEDKPVNKEVRWSTSNQKYASVNYKGVVKAKKAGKGKKVRITAMATDGSGKKKSVTIKIK